MQIEQLVVLYLRHHLHGKPSAPYYARLIRQVFPPIATCELATMDKVRLLEWWTALADRPGHANKALGLLRASFKWAVAMGFLPLLTVPDPTIGIAKRPEPMRSTTTSPDEWARLVPYLEDLPLKRRVYFWWLYLLGSRPGEVRMVQPSHVFLNRDTPCWIKPTTKNGRPHVVPLPEQLIPLCRLLLMANPPDAQWLFWGQRPAVVWGRTSCQKMWETLRAKAGLKHLWLNDLRRSTASDLLNQGENIGVVQSQLGHKSLSQTAKYAWLAVQPLQKALQARTDRIVTRI